MKRLFILLLLFSTLSIQATDLEVSNVSLNKDQGFVTFDLKWSNSWKNSKNHDAAWVFVKFEIPGQNPIHGRLTQDDHNLSVVRYSVKAGIEVPEDRTGAFVKPISNYRGNVHWSMELHLDPQVMSSLPANAQVKVYGFEMVYIPEGGFTLGDPDPKALNFSAVFKVGSDRSQKGLYKVDSEDQVIDVGTEEGNLFYDGGRYPIYTGDRKGPIPASFPKGVNPYYMMKYEVTQGQYAHFLNSLAPELASRLSPHTTDKYYESRGSIKFENGSYVAGSPNRPCNYITWDDGALFADWAGLRPMTELEYVKAARGPSEPIAHEFPWNTDNKEGLGRLVDLDDELKLKDGLNESQLNEGNRHQFGASYYWVMDLAGSLWEKCVSFGHPIGRAYTGSHGDGVLSADGSTNADWPKGINEEGGYGYRGGGYYQHGKAEGEYNPHSPIAYRPYAAWSGGKRSIAYSQRYVRTAKR